MRIDRRWVVAVTGAWALACSGAGDPAVAPPPPKPAPAAPVDVPDHLTPYLPANQRPAEVGTRDGAAFARYDGLSLSAVAAAWPASLEVLSRTDARLLAARWDDASRSFGLLSADKVDGGVTIRELPVVPDAGLPRANCAQGQVSLHAPWSGGRAVRGCVSVGSPARLVGKFEIGTADVTVLKGEYDAQGNRTGTWTLRDDGGRIVSTGTFADDRPFGRWTFGDEEDDRVAEDDAGNDGRARSYAFVDGQTADAPLAALPTASTDPHPYQGAALALIDADLDAGWVHATATYQAAASTGHAPAACPTPGGERRLILRPDKADPVAEFVVSALAWEGEPCTTPEAAAEATKAADAAFAADVHPADAAPAKLVGPPQRLPLDGTAPVSVALPPEIGKHALRWTVHSEPITLEQQLSEPALLDGSWESDDRSTVHRIELQLDQTPLDSLWVRWPTDCPDSVWVEGVVVQGRSVAPIYRTDACDHGSRWAVGEALEVVAPEPPR